MDSCVIQEKTNRRVKKETCSNKNVSAKRKKRLSVEEKREKEKNFLEGALSLRDRWYFFYRKIRIGKINADLKVFKMQIYLF